MENSPSADVAIDTDLVRSLLADQHPDLADLALEPLAHGWDNVIYRLGDEHTVRLPRRVEAVPLIEFELRWLPQLADRLPLPIPAAVRIGQPGPSYPWPWAICPFTRGSNAIEAPDIDQHACAIGFAEFLVALHQVAPGDAPENPYRGQPLGTRDDITRERMASITDAGLADAVEAAWDEVLAADPWTEPAIWLHGDLHPGNIVVDAGVLASVIDFGDITSGDPACDLMIAWSLLDNSGRQTFRDELHRRSADGPAPLDDAMWARGRGWAISHGLAVLASAADRPDYLAMAEQTLTQAAGADGAN